MATDLQYEQETTITFNQAEADAMVWSAAPTFQRRMKKLGIEPYQRTPRERGQESCWYRIPRGWIRVKAPIKRVFTEEQRQKRSAMARSRFSKSSPPETTCVTFPLDQERAKVEACA